MKRAFPALLAAALMAAGCSGAPRTPVPTITAPANAPATTTTTDAPALAVFTYTTPARVTGTQQMSCFARAHGMLPDPACTPGSVGETRAAAVCNAGFEHQHRPSGTLTPKRTAMKAYHLTDADLPHTEYDHLVPLSLGGSNDVTNLWPEVSDLPGQGFHNSKDGVELRVWRWVCTAPEDQRQARLSAAQWQMANSWPGALKRFGLQ